MKKIRILAMLLCIVMLLCTAFLPACDAEPEAEEPPVTDTKGDDKPEEPEEPEEEPPTRKPLESLAGKTIIWNGDSICQGTSAYGNWATRIAEKYNLSGSEWKNYGIGGGTVTENVFFQSGSLRHSVSATLEQMYEEFPNADYVILEGGTNDADLLGSIINNPNLSDFGSVDATDYSGNYNRNTFCGALESIFYRARIEYWPNAKICFIVAQEMGLEDRAEVVNNRYAYFRAAMEICEKWGIPYINLWDDSTLDPNDPEMYDPSKSAEENEQCSSMYRDGQHLTAKGYDYTTELIDTWLKSLG